MLVGRLVQQFFSTKEKIVGACVIRHLFFNKLVKVFHHVYYKISLAEDTKRSYINRTEKL